MIELSLRQVVEDLSVKTSLVSLARELEKTKQEARALRVEVSQLKAANHILLGTLSHTEWQFESLQKKCLLAIAS